MVYFRSICDFIFANFETKSKDRDYYNHIDQHFREYPLTLIKYIQEHRVWSQKRDRNE